MKLKHAAIFMVSYVAIVSACSAVVLYAIPADGPHPASRYGIPDTGMVLERTGYLLGYDRRNKQARWTVEVLTKESLVDNAERGGFRQDPDIPEEFRSKASDYEGSGFDIGHLAASANHQSTQEINDETFYLSNGSPQFPPFNRGVMRTFETDTRDLVIDGVFVKVFVLTVPLYLPKDGKVTYRTIGENNVSVPTHFGKSRLCIDADGEISISTYILPHRDMEDYRLYRASVNQLEAAAGFDAWSGLEDVTERRLESGK